MSSGIAGVLNATMTARYFASVYNVARPHMALGPGVPDPPAGLVTPANERSRHELGERAVVCARPVLGGLHHEYSLAPALA
jgi:hypothetical protein